MATGRDYFEFIAERFSGADEVSFRPMMGEYIIYCHGKVVGGIYDDRLLVKPTKSALAMMPDAETALPYKGGKEMLVVDDPDDGEFLRRLVNAIAEDLPDRKK